MAGPNTFEVKEMMLMQNMDATGANLVEWAFTPMEISSDMNTSPSIIPGGPGMGRNMGFSLGQLPDGDLALVCDKSLPGDVKRVEYYRDQRLLMLIYDLPDHEGELMHRELNDDVVEKVKKRSSMVIVQPDALTGRAMGYYASLIQVGA